MCVLWLTGCGKVVYAEVSEIPSAPLLETCGGITDCLAVASQSVLYMHAHSNVSIIIKETWVRH